MYSFKKSTIALVGLLVLVGVFAAMMPLVGRGQGGDNNPLNRDPRRSFYLTKTDHNGSQAPSACAAGYHMASVWEILDPSNLRYDTELGSTHEDSGFGPPTDFGWIRTGHMGNTSGSGGFGNCNAYTTSDSAYSGTIVQLSSLDWNLPAREVSPWRPLPFECNLGHHVWCVQD